MPLCQPDAKGVSAAFPLQGSWTPDGVHLANKRFALTCTSGAISKCIRMYKPWKGDEQWRLHQACTRAIRADYCGNGSSFTRDGVQVDVYDVTGLERSAHLSHMAFEAAWGEDGATCLRRTRVPDIAAVEDILARCGDRLRNKTGARCSEEGARRDPQTLLFNRSPTALSP